MATSVMNIKYDVPIDNPHETLYRQVYERAYQLAQEKLAPLGVGYGEISFYFDNGHRFRLDFMLDGNPYTIGGSINENWRKMFDLIGKDHNGD